MSRKFFQMRKFSLLTTLLAGLLFAASPALSQGASVLLVQPTNSTPIPALLDASNYPIVNCTNCAGGGVTATVNGGGTAGTANAGVISVQGIASMTPVAVSSATLATSALQTTGNTSLSTIATNTTGAATAAKQDTGNASLSTIATNTTGAATTAKQDTGNTSLASIDGKITAVNTGAVVISSGTVTTVGAVTAITNALPAGSNTIGAVNVASTTTGGCTPYHLSGGTAASTNSTSIKASAAATLCHLVALNTTNTVVFLKVYDSAAAPTCSSATGIKHVYPIPSSLTGAGFTIPIGYAGEAYTNGLGYCVTGGGGDTDNTNAVTGIYIEGSYK